MCTLGYGAGIAQLQTSLVPPAPEWYSASTKETYGFLLEKTGD